MHHTVSQNGLSVLRYSNRHITALLKRRDHNTPQYARIEIQGISGACSQRGGVALKGFEADNRRFQLAKTEHVP